VAFAVTARQSGNSGTSSGQTLTTSSATPTASSLFLVCWGQENDANATAPSYQAPSGGGLTYTLVGSAGATSYPWNGDDGFRLGTAVYRAPVGPSPTGFAVTVDSFSGTLAAFYGAVCLDVTGHDPAAPIRAGSVGIGGGSKAQGNTESGTVTLGATPSVGDLVVVAFTAGADDGGGFAVPTAGVGKAFTAVVNQNTPYCQTGVFYRVWDGTESTTITCSDLGQSVGNYSAVAFAVAPAAAEGETVEGSAAGSFGFAGTAAGVRRTAGAAAAAFGFTASADGTPRTPGAAAGSFGFTAAAIGVRRVVGAAAAALGFTGAATGRRSTMGTASGSFGFTGDATGVTGHPPVTGAASGTFGFTGSAVGRPRRLGAGSATFGFTGTASGRPRPVGAAAGSFGFTAAVSGVRRVFAAAAGLFGFTGAAHGEEPPPPYLPLFDAAASARSNTATAKARDNAATAAARTD
jgi:hypothetical protein